MPRLTILPLGGCGEVGLNATLFDYEGEALLLDCGALLGQHASAGVNKVVPGFEPLFEKGRRLLGVVLTHGHEDHIGALAALLAERDAPVFATPFTAALAKSRLERDHVVPAEARAQIARVTEVPLGGRFSAGPFHLEMIPVTHSVPHSAAVLIETPAGRVLHTGDFRLDPEPVIGAPTDLERLGAIGQEGVDLLMSDSTNAEVPGTGPSEREVADELERQVAATAQGRVVVTLMGSHVGRMAALAEIARKTDRKICLLGRTLERNWAFGVEHRLLPSDPHLLMEAGALAKRPRNAALVLASGSQGEFGGALTRIAKGQDSLLRMMRGEKVIFSARTIPGNETTVRKLVNDLSRQGVEVVGPRQAPVHASGHARAEEQAELLTTLRPRWMVPVYGERAMLDAHARTAQAALPEAGVRVIENGQALQLDAEGLHEGDKEPVSRRPLDGEGRVMDWGDIRDRGRISRSGLVVVSVTVDRSERLVADPVVTARGTRLDARQREAAVDRARAALESVDLLTSERIAEALTRAVREALGGRRGPEVEVLVTRLGRSPEP